MATTDFKGGGRGVDVWPLCYQIEAIYHNLNFKLDILRELIRWDISRDQVGYSNFRLELSVMIKRSSVALFWVILSYLELFWVNLSYFGHITFELKKSEK